MLNRLKHLSLTITLGLLILPGCSTKPIKPAVQPDAQQQAVTLAKMTNWKLRARIGLRSKQKSGTATMIWDETSAKRSLRLLGPLGGGVILLQQDASGVSIQDSNKKIYRGTEAGELIYQVTGWQIPVTGLRWWLLGLTEPGSDAIPVYDDKQRLLHVVQDGWEISMSNYSQFDNYELPGSLLIKTTTDKNSERYLRVKIIVKEWQFTE